LLVACGGGLVYESRQALRVVQLSSSDTIGGAARVAWNLSQVYRCSGHRSWLAVGHEHGGDPDVLLIPNDESRSWWARSWLSAGRLMTPFIGTVRGAGRLSQLMTWIGQPLRHVRRLRGWEDFDFPGTWRLSDLTPEEPDIVQCHNLHGWYFDLRVLPWLSRRVPVVLTLHDAWLFSGHCAHSFECERWKIGCGRCRDLTIYPAIKRDATAYNWRRKRDIYTGSRLYVITPSQWLMDKAQRSVLASGIVEAKVIPNGVDLSIFHPADRRAAREALKLPTEAKVVLFAANGIRRNVWKDYETMRMALAQISEHWEGEDILFLALGDDAPPEYLGKARVQFVPYQKCPALVAKFYQAADIYIHAARADTFPNTVLEALACGTPVVATAVGGIPEQVDDGQTGFLTPPGDPNAMATMIAQLLEDDCLRLTFGHQAANMARQRFDLNRQAEDYLNWYYEILKTWGEPFRRN